MSGRSIIFRIFARYSVFPFSQYKKYVIFRLSGMTSFCFSRQKSFACGLHLLSAVPLCSLLCAVPLSLSCAVPAAVCLCAAVSCVLLSPTFTLTLSALCLYMPHCSLLSAVPLAYTVLPIAYSPYEVVFSL